MAYVPFGKTLFVTEIFHYLRFLQFIQYLLLTPTYINILNVYAFCNTHDITWGTKGDDKAEALPTVKLKAGGKVDVSIPQDDSDLNSQYDAEMRLISVKAPKEVKVVGAQEKQEDYYKGFRSAVVLVWMFSNLALSAVVLSTAGTAGVAVNDTQQDRATIYMSVVLWSVAVLSGIRFIGAMWFLVVRMVSFSSMLSNRISIAILWTVVLTLYLVPRCLSRDLQLYILLVTSFEIDHNACGLGFSVGSPYDGVSMFRVFQGRLCTRVVGLGRD
jgi:hypothetical protein